MGGGTRWRSLVGGLGIVVGLVLYIALVATIGPLIAVHWTVEAIFYAVAGVLWVYPAAKLVGWSLRG